MPLSQIDAELPISEQKKALRKEFLKKRNAMSDKERADADASAFEIFLDLSCYKTADTILLYYPIKNEPNVLKIAERALKDKKRIAFPRCHKETRKMTFHTVTSLSELEEGAYGIPEPKESAKEVDRACAALCVIPALAIDKDGFRLGYGGGYYDRFLDSFDGITASIVYSDLLVDELPADDHDWPVDIIITEKEVFSPDAL